MRLTLFLAAKSEMDAEERQLERIEKHRAHKMCGPGSRTHGTLTLKSGGGWASDSTRVLVTRRNFDTCLKCMALALDPGFGTPGSRRSRPEGLWSDYRVR